MTDIEALRARMREAAEAAIAAAGDGPQTEISAIGAFQRLASPANVKALDAEITRLREDLDRVTRERDEAGKTPEVLRLIARAEAAEAALAKRDEEVARLRGALIQSGRNAGAFLTDEVSNDFLMHTPNQVAGRIKALTSKIEALTKEPTNAE